jgi:hypothetical protein
MAMNIFVLLIGGRSTAVIPAASREKRAWHKPTTMQVGGRSSSEVRQVAEAHGQGALDRDSRTEERKRRRIHPVARARRDIQVTRILLIEQIFHRERRQRIRVDLVTDASRFPRDKTMTDLDRWHDLESDNPLTFVGMYQFWAQRT